MTTRRLTFNENEPARPVELSLAEAQALDAAELAVVSRSPSGHGWEIAGGSKVGVVRAGDVHITVRPKIPIARLLFMIGYAQRPNLWRDLPVELDDDAGLPDALAHAFAYWARRAVDQGLLQGYVAREEALPVLRGRLRVGDQIARRPGEELPLEVSYDDFTFDIAENRLLLTAGLRLLAMPQVSPFNRKALRRIRLTLSEVTPVSRGAELPSWHPSRLNIRYHPALQLADLILAGDSFEQRVGDLRVSGFVLDMWKIYEDFVCVALNQAMRRHGGRSSLQHDLHLDRAGEVPMHPDYLWTHRDGRQVVVDAKYKAEKPDGFPNADLYQLLAYCTVLGLREGHLVYAKGNEPESTHAIAGADISIHCHTLDLTASPTDLLRQIAALASLVTRPSARSGPLLCT